MSERPKVGVGVIITNNGKVLMQKRMGSHGQGNWSFPGGHLEFGEGIEECAKRECLEELGIELSDIKKVERYTNDIFESEKKHYITLYCSAKIKSGIPRICEPNKCSEIKWFEFDKLPDNLFLPIKNLINEGFKFG